MSRQVQPTPDYNILTLVQGQCYLWDDATSFQDEDC